MPPTVDPAAPTPVLVVIHGMGGTGKAIGESFVPDAIANGWIIIAPNFTYGDWRDPDQVRRDDMVMIPALRQFLQELPAHLGVPIADRYMFVGFSRGAQIAQRYATFYPESTLAAAALSGGTYTLPDKASNLGLASSQMRFPYGIDGLEAALGKKINLERFTQVRFFVAVGARDNVTADVPRQWDALLGSNRVERAQAYHAALARMGVDIRLLILPNTGHEMAPQFKEGTVAFLRSAVAAPLGTLGCIAPSNPIPDVIG